LEPHKGLSDPFPGPEDAQRLLFCLSRIWRILSIPKIEVFSSSSWHCLYWKVQIDTCSGLGRSGQLAGTSMMEKDGISKGSVSLWDLLWA